MRTYFVHPSAIVENGAKIGQGSKVWAFTHILPGAVIGRDCNICDGVFIENDVIVGDRVTIKCGVQLWDGVRLDDDVFIGPNATFTNDPYPRSKQYPMEFAKTIVHKGASIGANATLLPGIVIGCNAMVGAGAVVTRDVPQNAIVVGNPARISGYVSSTRKISHKTIEPSDLAIVDTNVPEAKIYKLPSVTDMRGNLVFGQYDQHLPFLPKRFFMIFDVPSKEVRGEHAHKQCQQFIICQRGSVHVMIDNGTSQDEIILDNPSIGLYIPPLIWAVQYKYTEEAILLVFASEVYQAEDYIRQYDEFLRQKGIS